MTEHLLASIALLEATASLAIRGRRYAAHEVRRRGQRQPATMDDLCRHRVDVWSCNRAITRSAGLAPWRVRCLPAAFALQRLLEWQGITSAMRLGVRTAGDGIVAHAWVECAEWKLDPLAPEDEYIPLPSAVPDDAERGHA